MMDEMDIDPDTIVRLKCLDYATEMADRAAALGQFILVETDQLIAAATELEHYATNGATVAFEPGAAPRKSVRGGI